MIRTRTTRSWWSIGWLAPLPYPYRTGRPLGAPSERQGQPSGVHGDGVGAAALRECEDAVVVMEPLPSFDDLVWRFGTEPSYADATSGLFRGQS